MSDRGRRCGLCIGAAARHASTWRVRRWLAILAVPLFLGGCASLPTETGKVATLAATDTADTRLGRDITPIVATHPGKSGFYVLNDGLTAFAARFFLVANAQKTLDLQYYIWHDDLTGKVLYNRLLEAADRGVRVRLLLDDLDTAGKDEMLRAVDAHPNIEIRLFNPFVHRDSRFIDFVTDMQRVNHRMHNKALIADNQAAIFGGRNTGDEYFDAAERVGFSDMEVLTIGPVVGDVSGEFDLYWNSQWTYPLSAFAGKQAVNSEQVEAFRRQSDEFIQQAASSEYADALRGLHLADIQSIAELDYSWGRWILVYDEPSKVGTKAIRSETHLAPRLKEALDRTTSDLIIVSPYFVPGPNFTGYLTDKVSKGVRVRIMTNSLAANDVPLVHSGYMRYRKDLIKGGVELYEFKPVKGVSEEAKKTKAKWSGSSRASLHGKFLGFDRRYLFIGSFNLDARSVALNTELGVYFESPRYAVKLSDEFDEIALEKAYRVTLDDRGNLQWTTLEDGKEVTYYSEPETGFWKRFGAGFMSIFVPESQL